MAGDDLQRRGLVSDLARRLHLASHDELRVLDRLFTRLELGRDRYGHLRLPVPRDWRRDFGEELLDAIIYDTIETTAAEDAQRSGLHEAARREMLGEDLAIAVEPPRAAEWQRDSTRLSNVPAQLAGADPRDSYDELAIEETGGEGG